MFRRIMVLVVVLSLVPIASGAGFTDTTPVSDSEDSSTAQEIGLGEVRIEVPHDTNSWAGDVTDRRDKYAVKIETTSTANKTIFVPIDKTRLHDEHGENIAFMNLRVDGESTDFQVEDHIGRTWIRFNTISENPNVVVTPPGSTGGISGFLSLFKQSPMSVLMLVGALILGFTVGYQQLSGKVEYL